MSVLFTVALGLLLAKDVIVVECTRPANCSNDSIFISSHTRAETVIFDEDSEALQIVRTRDLSSLRYEGVNYFPLAFHSSCTGLAVCNMASVGVIDLRSQQYRVAFGDWPTWQKTAKTRVPKDSINEIGARYQMSSGSSSLKGHPGPTATLVSGAFSSDARKLAVIANPFIRRKTPGPVPGTLAVVDLTTMQYCEDVPRLHESIDHLSFGQSDSSVIYCTRFGNSLAELRSVDLRISALPQIHGRFTHRLEGHVLDNQRKRSLLWFWNGQVSADPEAPEFGAIVVDLQDNLKRRVHCPESHGHITAADWRGGFREVILGTDIGEILVVDELSDRVLASKIVTKAKIVSVRCVHEGDAAMIFDNESTLFKVRFNH